jgi:CHAT domain-containing protein
MKTTHPPLIILLSVCILSPGFDLLAQKSKNGFPGFPPGFTPNLLPPGVYPPGFGPKSKQKAMKWLTDDAGNDEKIASLRVKEFLENKEECLKEAKEAWGAGTTQAAFKIAEEAYKQGSPASSELLTIAEEIAARSLQKGSGFEMMPVTSSHTQLLRSLLDLGHFDVVLEVIDRAKERKKSFKAPKIPGLPSGLMPMINDNSEMAESLILLEMAELLGDFDQAERIATESIERFGKIEKTTQQMLPANMQFSLNDMWLPRLAHILAQQGRKDEAAKVLESYEASDAKQQKALSNFGFGFFHAFRTCSDGILLASTWLVLGEADKAIKVLERVQAQIDSMGSGKAGLPAQSNAVVEFLPAVQSRVDMLFTKAHWAAGKAQETLDAAKRGMESLRKLKNYPDNHPNMISLRQLLAWAALAVGDKETAANESAALANLQVEAVAGLFRFASERQRLVYLQNADPFSLLVATGQDAALFQNVVRLKGTVLDSITKERQLASRASSGEAKEVLQKLNARREALNQAFLSGDTNVSALSKEVESLESKLASLTSTESHSTDFLGSTIDKVLSFLNPHEVVVEFIQYRKMSGPGKWEQHYGAVILRSQQVPAWVPLGGTTGIDASVQKMTSLVSTSTEKNEEVLKTDLRSLYDQLIVPLLPHLVGVKRIIWSPDGGLSGLAFGVLLSSDDSFAAEQWEMAYISTCRDLMKAASPQPESASMVIIAAPSYDTAVPLAKVSQNRVSAMAVDRGSLPELGPLPGTAMEKERLTQILENNAFTVKALTASEATEPVVIASLKGATHIHFATHGLVLAPSATVRRLSRGQGYQVDSPLPAPTPAGGQGLASSSPPPSQADQPLLRSMLCLTGANASLKQWKQGQHPPTLSDGLLTAQEVAALDLDSAWLAVLSACDTASGDALSGEGVLGMRRGFLAAGVDHLLMTFWSIADEETVQVMADFYKAIGDKVHPTTALHRVQREALVKWRKEKGLQSAVFLAGPFALSTTGKLPPN